MRNSRNLSPSIVNERCKVKSEQPNAISGKIEELASLAKMPTAERESYQRSLDRYRSIAATYVYEREQGWEQGRLDERNFLIEKLHQKGMTDEEIEELLS